MRRLKDFLGCCLVLFRSGVSRLCSKKYLFWTTACVYLSMELNMELKTLNATEESWSLPLAVFSSVWNLH
ncbi:hypothetical protein H6P81_002534 [Aristolochia fimbriata]|uniref:Uncharacterized protein n=1 Tax=Aristolochia fimbriata TaxID=158543 RepID=A0AAV7FDV8_ARIFI|nr:hypothetical protein H6P81_002534 [Aristolochia fimbriata]